jgi:MYXO-CTERM domain-containing protein
MGVAAVVATITGAAGAEVLLLIDLTVENQMTVTATNGLSAVTSEGSDTNGIYLQNFFAAGAVAAISANPDVGDFTTFGNTSDGGLSIYRGVSGADTGLNFWSWTDDPNPLTVTAGQQALVGSATFTLSEAVYALLIQNTGTGELWFNADTADDIGGPLDPGNIGQWSVVPAPGALAMLGLAGLAGRRRRN